MSNNIIKFFKGFASGNFAVGKQAERAVFQQNVETVFSNDLATVVAQLTSDTDSTDIGSIVLWEAANGGTHCGIVIKNGKVLRIDVAVPYAVDMPDTLLAGVEAKQFLDKITPIHPINDWGQRLGASGTYVASTGVYSVAENDKVEMIADRFRISLKFLPIYPILEGEKFYLYVNSKAQTATSFEESILISVSALKLIDFGSIVSAAPTIGGNTIINYDATYWDDRTEENPYTGGFETVLVIHKDNDSKKDKKEKVAEAIRAILTNIAVWKIDCSIFVQISFLLATKLYLGEEAFNMKMLEIVNLERKLFRLRHHHSFGIERFKVIERKLIYNSATSDYVFPIDEIYQVRQSPQKVQIIAKTINEVLNEAPIGSRVAIMNLGVVQDDAYRIENTIKVGNGLYAGHPLRMPDGRNILTLVEIFTLLQQQTNLPNANNLFISEVEYYETPKRKEQ